MLEEKEFFRRFEEMVPGSLPPEGSSKVIETEIYFERLSMAGLEEMHRYSKNPRLYEFMEYEPFDTIEKTKAYIEKLEQRMEGSGSLKTSNYWFVRRKADNYLVGTAALVSLSYARQSIEWGYGIDPELWGHGYIMQIEETLKQYVFEVLQLNRLHGMTMITNERTIQSLLATGMKNEGIPRQIYCKDGVFIDGWMYSLLRGEYFDSLKEITHSATKHTVDDVIEVVASVLTGDDIDQYSHINNSSGWDSLSHMEIMVAISEKLGVTLSPGEIMRATSVKAITSIITNSSTKEK